MHCFLLQKPKLLLGKCQYKNSAYKGDILKDNDVDIANNEVMQQPTHRRHVLHKTHLTLRFTIRRVYFIPAGSKEANIRHRS